MKKLLYSFFAIYITCTAKAQDAVDIWNLPPLNVEQGRYTTDWDNLSRQYNTPSWWREAKLGAWSHWDPQSMAEDGDWYSRGMYMEGHPQSKFHREHFGHPSEYDYKELCRDWKIDLWDPEDLMRLYQKMGARYFLALGNHHDNFDCWDSKYQPWNAVNIGPHQDIVGVKNKELSIIRNFTPRIKQILYNYDEANMKRQCYSSSSSSILQICRVSLLASFQRGKNLSISAWKRALWLGSNRWQSS